jgi:hypothetical protein
LLEGGRRTGEVWGVVKEDGEGEEDGDIEEDALAWGEEWEEGRLADWIDWVRHGRWFSWNDGTAEGGTSVKMTSYPFPCGKNEGQWWAGSKTLRSRWISFNRFMEMDEGTWWKERKVVIGVFIVGNDINRSCDDRFQSKDNVNTCREDNISLGGEYFSTFDFIEMSAEFWRGFMEENVVDFLSRTSAPSLCKWFIAFKKEREGKITRISNNLEY